MRNCTHLMQFQQDVAAGRTEAIYQFIQAVAKEEGNKQLDVLFSHYGFQTFYDAISFDGWRVGLARDLSQLAYGRANIGSLGYLLRRYGFDLYNLRGLTHNTCDLIKGHFSLAKSTPKIGFVTWQHVLLIGARGGTKFARKMLWPSIQTMLTRAEADEALQTQSAVSRCAAMTTPTQHPLPTLSDQLAQVRDALRMARAQVAALEAEEARLLTTIRWEPNPKEA